jgi:hypothetical protein
MADSAKKHQRNLNPHKAARVAMILWGSQYAAGGRGSMDFWDQLSESDQKLCRGLVAEILEAPSEGEVTDGR